MNAKAERPDWLPIVEQCERQRSIDGLPSLEALYGRGNWSLMVSEQKAEQLEEFYRYFVRRSLAQLFETVEETAEFEEIKP